MSFFMFRSFMEKHLILPWRVRRMSKYREYLSIVSASTLSLSSFMFWSWRSISVALAYTSFRTSPCCSGSKNRHIRRDDTSLFPPLTVTLYL